MRATSLVLLLVVAGHLQAGPLAKPAAQPPPFPFSAAAATQYQKEYAANANLPAELTNFCGMTFVLVPPGTFWMGSADDEPGRYSDGYDEGPRHQVTITRPFYLGTHEVTFGQFARFVAAASYVTDGERTGGGHAHDAKAEWKHRPGTHWKMPGFAGPFEQRDDHPVVHVSHADALAFCGWLAEQPGGDLEQLATAAQRSGFGALTVECGLPTEAQWEWACRAGSSERYWWGPEEDTSGKLANVGDRALQRVLPEWPRQVMPMDDGHVFLAPVGSYRGNGFGLHDMIGNVWEFCSTHYAAYPDGPVVDPAERDPQRGFAVRGGGWSNAPRDVRSAVRNADPAHFCHSNLGFRVAFVLAARKTDERNTGFGVDCAQHPKGRSAN
jgi:formylglycine-generating enzyme required for sulfatase activity